MKKLGLLAALATCVTIGGVYAAWTYADTTSFVDRETVSIGLTPATNTTGESLEIVEGTNTLKFLLDDSDGDKKGDAIVASGSVTVRYNALENNFETVTIYCNVEIDGNIFATTLQANELNSEEHTFDGTGADFEWTVNAADLKIVVGSQEVYLPTKADYDAFTISGNQIRVEFTTSPRA